jgi:hypothetical protein
MKEGHSGLYLFLQPLNLISLHFYCYVGSLCLHLQVCQNLILFNKEFSKVSTFFSPLKETSDIKLVALMTGKSQGESYKIYSQLH